MSTGFDTGFVMDMGDVDTEKLSGPPIVAVGKYHGQVTQWGVGMPGYPNLIWFDVEVLAGTTPSQEGKTQRIMFDNPAGVEENRRGVCKSKLIAWGAALKLCSIDEAKEAKKSGKSLRLDFPLAVGRQVCFEVEANEKRKSGTQVKDWAYYSVDDPKAAGIPINGGMVAKATDASADPFGTPAADDPF